MLTQEQIIKNAQVVDGLIEEIVSTDLRNKLKFILNKYPEYYSAPASANAKYHGSYPGGLVEHALFVYSVLSNFAKNLNWIHKDDIVFLSLFFQIGKATLFELNNDNWQREKQGRNYLYKEENFMPFAHRSLKILQENSVLLTNENYIAILLSDNMYSEDVKLYAYREPKIALLLQWANRWAIDFSKENHGS